MTLFFSSVRHSNQVLTGLDICSLDIKSDLAGHDFRYMTLLTVEKGGAKKTG